MKGRRRQSRGKDWTLSLTNNAEDLPIPLMTGRRPPPLPLSTTRWKPFFQMFLGGPSHRLLEKSFGRLPEAWIERKIPTWGIKKGSFFLLLRLLS
jgi:hypothetical protein